MKQLETDSGNLILAESPEAVDAANREFYARFPYPWPPMSFPRVEDPDFETIMLNQSVGDFDRHTIPPDAKIWVAGCGANQAVYTALRFPRPRSSDLIFPRPLWTSQRAMQGIWESRT